MTAGGFLGDSKGSATIGLRRKGRTLAGFQAWRLGVSAWGVGRLIGGSILSDGGDQSSTANKAGDRVVMVFVSSTFRDIRAERDHLIAVVFPELRERLALLGLELHDVDLRWGVPVQGVDGDRVNGWDYCRRAINRAKPLFLAVLGERYGWIPSASERAMQPATTTTDGQSIT